MAGDCYLSYSHINIFSESSAALTLTPLKGEVLSVFIIIPYRLYFLWGKSMREIKIKEGKKNRKKWKTKGCLFF